jgi:hypothetical protein
MLSPTSSFDWPSVTPAQKEETDDSNPAPTHL